MLRVAAQTGLQRSRRRCIWRAEPEPDALTQRSASLNTSADVKISDVAKNGATGRPTNETIELDLEPPPLNIPPLAKALSALIVALQDGRFRLEPLSAPCPPTPAAPAPGESAWASLLHHAEHPWPYSRRARQLGRRQGHGRGRGKHTYRQGVVALSHRRRSEVPQQLHVSWWPSRCLTPERGRR